MAEPLPGLLGDLTPAQRKALEKDAIRESWSPLDFLVGGGLGAGIGGAAGYGLTRAGQGLNATADGRHQMNVKRGFSGDSRDAESQPGGFYGQYDMVSKRR